MSPTPAATAPAITGPFADVLRAGRDHFNARFAEARRVRPQLDEAAFSLHLIENVTPIVDAVARAKPDAIGTVTQTAYDLSLELVAQNLVGLAAPDQLASRVWRDLVPVLAAHTATHPRKVLGALTNAAVYFGDYPGSRGDEWLRRMRAVAPLAPTFEDVLGVGQVIAWQCGLAHFRDGALEATAKLRPDVALAALGLRPVDAAQQERDAAVAALRADRWMSHMSVSAGTQPSRIEIVCRAGGFRGFGGPFVTPPLVASDGERLFARSDNGCWLVTADAFGAVFHRAGVHEFERARESAARQGKAFTLVRGKVRCGPLDADLPDIATVTSIAQTADTLAATTPLSHAIVLVAAVA